MTEKSSHPAGGANSTGALYSGLQPGLVPQRRWPIAGTRLTVKTEARPRMSGEEYYVHLAKLSEPKRLTSYVPAVGT